MSVKEGNATDADISKYQKKVKKSNDKAKEKRDAAQQKLSEAIAAEALATRQLDLAKKEIQDLKQEVNRMTIHRRNLENNICELTQLCKQYVDMVAAAYPLSYTFEATYKAKVPECLYALRRGAITLKGYFIDQHWDEYKQLTKTEN